MIGEIELRPATATDGAFLRALYATTRDDLRGVSADPGEVDRFITMQWRAQHADYTSRFPDAAHDIIAVDGQDVGRVWVDRRPDEIRLLDIIVAPEHQGRGTGTTLINRLQDEARSRRTALRHSVHTGNLDARRLYERLGFEVIESFDTHLLMEWRQRLIVTGAG